MISGRLKGLLLLHVQGDKDKLEIYKCGYEPGAEVFISWEEDSNKQKV